MESIWQLHSQKNSFPALKENIKTDVLIIGGGIAGILTAYFLHQKNIPYVLVEKNTICSGNTQNTTAKITSQHGLIYHKILQSEGSEKAVMYLKANEEAIRKYKELCKTIDCDFEEKDNYVYSTDNINILEDELSALRKIGYKAELQKNLPLPVKTAGAVCFKNQAQFNPLKFLREIAKDLNIYENTFITEMIGCTAKTENNTIEAKKVIVATHFPFINKHGLYPLKMYQDRSYVIALKNAQNVSGMYVDEKKTGLSFRNYGKYLLLGGGSHRTGKQGGNWTELREFKKKNYPDAEEVAFWAAQDCISLDEIPYIGNYSKKTPDLYVATGFNKWGMTSAMVSAIIITDMICDKKNDYAEVFNPSRSILKPQLFANSFESAINLLTPTTRRCPHLDCALKWNKAEHSWDCPCHGSRFTQDGKVLDNPANKQ